MVVALSEPNGCCVDEAEMMVIRDLNMTAPHKGGNQYARICPECGSRQFTTKKYWESVDDPYVIPKGDKQPARLFACPYDECDDGTIYEGEEVCDDCGNEVEWLDEDEEESQTDDATEEAPA